MWLRANHSELMLAKEWENAGHEYDEIRGNCLGWDITDYGLDDLDEFSDDLKETVKFLIERWQ